MLRRPDITSRGKEMQNYLNLADEMLGYEQASAALMLQKNNAFGEHDSNVDMKRASILTNESSHTHK